VANRKQRRRRAKEFRHEYVWEDAEGNEIEPSEVPAQKAEGAPRPGPKRAGREPQPPSWRRTLRRGLIFAPVMFVVVTVLSANLSLADRVIQSALVALVFLPFSYFLDGFFWRSYQRRMRRIDSGPRRRS
jgi:hypothetical protein